MPELLDLIEPMTRVDGHLVFLPSGEEVPYPELWRRSESVARYLTARVGSGGAVAAVLSNTSACAPNVLGVWRSGNDLVSLPHPSRGSTIERYRLQLETMLDLTGVSLLLVDAAFLPLIPELKVPVVAYEEALKGGPPCDASKSGNLIQFTSGSVGTPKGVVLPSRSVAANVASLIEVLQPAPGDVPGSWLPLSHDMGFIGMFLTGLAAAGPDVANGGNFPLMTPEYFLSSPAAWLQVCSQFGVTITTAPNFAMDLAVRAGSRHGALDLSRLRICITGAERVSPDTVKRFTSTFADAGLPARSICPAYGMAEATLAVTIVRPQEQWRSITVDRAALGAGRLRQAPDGAAVEAGLEYVSNGAPLPRVEVRIAAPAGDVGEVQVRSESLLSRYIGADLRLVDDGWFATRDLGFLSDGELFLIGRSDDSVIVGGRNYYATDIEATMRHAAVRDGCLAAVPLQAGGYGLVAELRADVPASEQEQVCRELGVTATRDVGVRPAVVAIVPRGQLPKTPSGKIQRLRIAESIRTGDIETTALVSFGGPL